MDNLNSLLPRVIRDLGLLTSELQKIDGVLNGGRHRSAEVQIISNTRSAKAGLDGETPELPPVIPGQYQGLRPIDALENYLRARRGVRIRLARAVEDLLAGGADSGPKKARSPIAAKRMMQDLKIAIPNKAKVFAWEPMAKTRTGRPGTPRGDVSITIWLAARASPQPNVDNS